MQRQRERQRHTPIERGRERVGERGSEWERWTEERVGGGGRERERQRKTGRHRVGAIEKDSGRVGGKERGGEKGTEGETVMQIDIDVPPNNVTTVPYTIPPLNMLIAFLFIVWAPPP